MRRYPCKLTACCLLLFLTMLFRHIYRFDCAFFCIWMVLFASFSCSVPEVASFFEVWKCGTFGTKQPELFETNHADIHTLVSFFRRNIPCSCLDEKYKEVKSVTRVGLCHNPNCSLPGHLVKRRKMLYCTRCGTTNYCSRECQVEDWPRHRKNCSLQDYLAGKGIYPVEK